MKKLNYCIQLLLLLAVGGRAQDHADGLYSVAFYNLENLFDTIHDTGKNDYEYLPDAAKGWNSEKYRSKLKNLSKVLGELRVIKYRQDLLQSVWRRWRTGACLTI